MMDRIAYHYMVDKDGFRLVLANESGGYSEMKQDGDPDPRTGRLRDPFYKAKGTIRFGNLEAASAETKRRNELELGLTATEAAEIVGHSMAAAQPRRVAARGRFGSVS